MASLVKGIHHITVCASPAHYHLYYANANAEVGSI